MTLLAYQITTLGGGNVLVVAQRSASAQVERTLTLAPRQTVTTIAADREFVIQIGARVVTVTPEKAT